MFQTLHPSPCALAPVCPSPVVRQVVQHLHEKHHRVAVVHARAPCGGVPCVSTLHTEPDGQKQGGAQAVGVEQARWVRYKAGEWVWARVS